MWSCFANKDSSEMARGCGGVADPPVSGLLQVQGKLDDLSLAQGKGGSGLLLGAMGNRHSLHGSTGQS